ncbi:cell envelope biogenesis protein OmpA [Streptomyces sp. NPDC021080]|uniref:cell envelope biogenesis protein OmpA n=1 Tax=Streptomyces sp. NPDC021080 TaxID=3365110 RepID=UPI00379B55D3
MVRPLPRTRAPLGPEDAEVLRLITQRRFPVLLTVHANGRRRYGYWLPFDPSTGRGGCYVALPTDECDALHAAGRIVLGAPLVDPAKTTYAVQSAARTTATGRSEPTRRTERADPAQVIGRTGTTGRTEVRGSTEAVESSVFRAALTA